MKDHLFGIESERKGSGRRGRTVGGMLSDMAFLKKAILLCSGCLPKWNPRAYNYEAKTLSPVHDFVVSKCDACGYFTRCTLHLSKEGSS